MASILQTDVLELYNSWGERVAFNEGFQAQKIADAKQAGRDSFSLGLDRSQGRELYMDAKDQRFSEAKEFLAGEPAAQISDESISDVEPESIEPDQIGDVTDGEETLGMESVVANESEDLAHTDDGAVILQDDEGYLYALRQTDDGVLFADYAHSQSDDDDLVISESDRYNMDFEEAQSMDMWRDMALSGQGEFTDYARDYT